MVDRAPDLVVERWVRVRASPNTELVKVWGRGHAEESSVVQLLLTTDRGTSTVSPLPNGPSQPSVPADSWTWGFAISRLPLARTLTLYVQGIRLPLLSEEGDHVATGAQGLQAAVYRPERARARVVKARERRELDVAREIGDAGPSVSSHSKEEKFDEWRRAMRIALSTEQRRRRAAEEGKELASTELARMAGTLMILRGQAHELESRLAASRELMGAEGDIHAEIPRTRSRRHSIRGGRVVAGIAALASLAIAGAFLGGDDSRGGAGTASGGDRGVLETGRTPVVEGSVATIPSRYLRIYRTAGRTYGLDWAMLAAVGMTESNHGRSPYAGVQAGRNARGAIGPAQFLQATWERFGVDANANGIRSPYEPADAIAAMASYLRAEGAPDDWGSALFAYNPDRTYVERILRSAAVIRAQTAR